MTKINHPPIEAPKEIYIFPDDAPQLYYKAEPVGALKYVLAPTKPVSSSPVSLMYCAERLRDKFAMSWNSREINCRWADLARVVLDYAGVKYVD